MDNQFFVGLFVCLVPLIYLVLTTLGVNQFTGMTPKLEHEADSQTPDNVLAVGNACGGDWTDEGWICSCGAKQPRDCKTETAKP